MDTAPPNSATNASGDSSLSNLQCVLRLVDRYACGRSGVLSIRADSGTDEPDISVAVQLGRICWATSRHSMNHLPAFLQNYFPQDGSTKLEQWCLSEKGLPGVSQEANTDKDFFRCAVRQHLIEALMRAPNEFAPTWTDHCQETYVATHAFAAAELLARAGEWLFATHANGANLELSRLTDAVGSGLSFFRSSSGELHLVAAIDANDLTVKELMETGSAALQILELSTNLCPNDRVTCSTTPFGSDFVTWESGSVIHCILCRDSTQLATMLMSVTKLIQTFEMPTSATRNGCV